MKPRPPTLRSLAAQRAAAVARALGRTATAFAALASQAHLALPRSL